MQDTKNYKLVYLNSYQDYFKLKIYIDADSTRNKETKRSSTIYVVLFNSTAISWAFKRQTSIEKSLYEAKYIVALEVVKEAVLINRFLEKLHQT